MLLCKEGRLQFQGHMKEYDSIEEAIKSFSEEDRRTIKDIITAIKNSRVSDLESLIVLLVKKMLSAMMEEGYDLEQDLANLTPDQIKELEENLALIAAHLEKHGSLGTRKTAAKLLISALSRYFNRKHGSKTKGREQEEEYDFLTEKQLKDLKEQIKRHVIYEFYKFANPRRIAGETAKENFCNNLVRGGIEYAMKFEGAEYASKLDKGFLKQLNQAHQQYRGMGR